MASFTSLPFALLTIILCITSCSKSVGDASLIKIQRLVDIDPDSAKVCFDNVDYATLSSHDRHLYDFLKIKINDKLRVKHTNDSLVLEVIDYYRSSGCDSLYTEALYYGGRVYSDMGSYPEAQSYFQQTLDRLPHDTPNHLRGRTLSQTGRLLNKLRLYSQAVPYIEEVIELNRKNNDTISLVSNLNLLGAVQIHLHDYHRAKQSFNNALSLGSKLPPSYRAKSRMYLADVYSKTNNLDSALIYLRQSADSISRGSLNTLSAIAAEAYYNARMYDTTYIYAKELAESSDNANKQIGYYFLLSPELRKYSSLDSLIQYIGQYSTIVDSYFDSNDNNLSLNQRAQYNYDIHSKARLKAEKTGKILRTWIIVLGILSLIMIAVIIYLTWHVRNLKKEINHITSIDGVVKHLLDNSGKHKEIDVLVRTSLQNEILDRINQTDQKAVLTPVIESSPAYKKLLELIDSHQIIGEGHPIWKELETVVLESSPRFINNLKILSAGKYTTTDLQTALLVKCFIAPKDMEILLGRSKGTIVSRRISLSKKLFDTNLKTETIDEAIRLL